MAKQKIEAKPKTDRPIVQAAPSSCPKCGSTERTPYSDTTSHAIVGINPATGQEYNHVIWRSTCCANCGQRRRDRSFEMKAARKTGRPRKT